MESTWVADSSLSFDLNSRVVDETLDTEIQSPVDDMGRKFSVQDENDVLIAELNRMSAENKRLTEMLTILCENYNNLQSHVMELMNKSPEKEVTATTKRKSGSCDNGNCNQVNGVTESSSSDEDSCKKPREEIKTQISKVYVRTDESDTTLVVRDGYQWRKYGQKVTRDNPSPRAYFKCSFAPGCPVKKKVQRSVEDRLVLVATYEGEHNHPQPLRAEAALNSSRGVNLTSVPSSASERSSNPAITLNLTQPGSNTDNKRPTRNVESPELQRFLVEQMASSLTKDPNFTAALAAAISGRIAHQSPAEKR